MQAKGLSKPGNTCVPTAKSLQLPWNPPLMCRSRWSGTAFISVLKATSPTKNFMEGVPSIWAFGESESGYMDGEWFRRWFKDIFLEHCGSRRPVLLICDNDDSHISFDLMKMAVENGVEILGFPSHTTHILQPLDVAMFGSLKNKVTSLAASLGFLNTDITIGKSKFPALVRYFTFIAVNEKRSIHN